MCRDPLTVGPSQSALAALVVIALSLGCARALPPPPSVACPRPTGPILEGASFLSAGPAITCAVIGGRVACWGASSDGNLGDGTERDTVRLAPVWVHGIDGVVAVTSYHSVTFAQRGDGSVWVWGGNEMGGFGDGSPAFHVAWTPRRLDAWGTVRSMSAGIPTCAASTGARALCAGYPRFRSTSEDPTDAGPLVASIEGLDEVVQVSAGAGFSCALRRDGTVWCWGMNDYGQLGVGRSDDRAEPVRARVRDVAQIDAGGDTACARTHSGEVRCWGAALAPSEVGEPREAWRPRTIDDVEGAIDLSVGDHVACAVIAGGSVRCWGDGSYDGQLGDGTTYLASPTRGRPVQCVEGARSVSVGTNHACALSGRGVVQCWGSGPYGAIGDGTREPRAVPTFVHAPVDPAPPEGRCPDGTEHRAGKGDDPEHEATASWCELPDGRRHGTYVSRWATGQKLQEGEYHQGARVGDWRMYYEQGWLLTTAHYEEGLPHGVWTSYSPREGPAFRTCFDRGRRVWQAPDTGERRACP